MKLTEIHALIGKYTMANYNPFETDEWLTIRKQLINVRNTQSDEFRKAILDVVESTIRLLQIEEYN